MGTTVLQVVKLLNGTTLEQTIATKLISRDDIPGGLIKRTVTRKKGDTVVSDSVLELSRSGSTGVPAGGGPTGRRRDRSRGTHAHWRAGARHRHRGRCYPIADGTRAGL